jgi:predicted peptidase
MNCMPRTVVFPIMRSLLVLLLLVTASFVCHAGEPASFVARSVHVHGKTWHYQVFIPDGWTAKRSWPVVLFLHGSGERGDDNRSQLSQGLPAWLRQHGKDFPAIVVIPQAPQESAWNGEVEHMALQALDDSISAYHGDRQRLYLTGLSMGGYGAWQIAVDHPGMFAAAAIICGGIRHPNDNDRLRVRGIPGGVADPYAWVAEHLRALPVWIFNGAIDDVVPPEESHRMHAALEARGSEVRYTEFPGVGHGSWDAAYATQGLWPWMFAHRLAPSPSRRKAGSIPSAIAAPAAPYPADIDAQRRAEQFAQHARADAVGIMHLRELGLEQLQ